MPSEPSPVGWRSARPDPPRPDTPQVDLQKLLREALQPISSVTFHTSTANLSFIGSTVYFEGLKESIEKALEGIKVPKIPLAGSGRSGGGGDSVSVFGGATFRGGPANTLMSLLPRELDSIIRPISNAVRLMSRGDGAATPQLKTAEERLSSWLKTGVETPAKNAGSALSSLAGFGARAGVGMAALAVAVPVAAVGLAKFAEASFESMRHFAQVSPGMQFAVAIKDFRDVIRDMRIGQSISREAQEAARAISDMKDAFEPISREWNRLLSNTQTGIAKVVKNLGEELTIFFGENLPDILDAGARAVGEKKSGVGDFLRRFFEGDKKEPFIDMWQYMDRIAEQAQDRLDHSRGEIAQRKFRDREK